MNDIVKNHIENALSEIRAIFEQAAERIEALGDNEKVPATKLAEELAEKIDLTGPGLYPTLKFLLKGYPGVDIKRGAYGGIVKLAPVVDPPKELEVKTEEPLIKD